MKVTGVTLLLLGIAAGCATKQAQHTTTGKEVLTEQPNVSLYRKAPKVWPAKGKVLFTADELVFIPTPYFGALHINGRDSTYIRLSDMEDLREDSWMLLFPFKLKLTTGAGAEYTLVTARRRELIRKIREAQQEE